jgi:hypothetical protein
MQAFPTGVIKVVVDQQGAVSIWGIAWGAGQVVWIIASTLRLIAVGPREVDIIDNRTFSEPTACQG